MVSIMVILFSKKCFLFVYMYVDLLKLKANKFFENSDADLPCNTRFFTHEMNELVLSLTKLYRILLSCYGQWEKTLPSLFPSKRRVASLTSSKIVSNKCLSNQSTKNQQLLLSESELLFYNFLPSVYLTGRFSYVFTRT